MYKCIFIIIIITEFIFRIHSLVGVTLMMDKSYIDTRLERAGYYICV